MTASTQIQRINLSNAKALRRSREVMKVTRSEVAVRLKVSPQAIEKYEPGRALIDEEKIIRYLSALDEVRKFLLEAKIQKHPWFYIWAFAILTGMRSGELMALEWGDVDEKNGSIRVSKSFNKRLRSTKCPKNGTWRNVDINSQLLELILELKRRRLNE